MGDNKWSRKFTLCTLNEIYGFSTSNQCFIFKGIYRFSTFLPSPDKIDDVSYSICGEIEVRLNTISVR